MSYQSVKSYPYYDLPFYLLLRIRRFRDAVWVCGEAGVMRNRTQVVFILTLDQPSSSTPIKIVHTCITDSLHVSPCTVCCWTSSKWSISNRIINPCAVFGHLWPENLTFWIFKNRSFTRMVWNSVTFMGLGMWTHKNIEGMIRKS